MKMPEPVGYAGEIPECATLLIEKPFWAAIPLYDKQALIDLLEEAAKECEAEDVAPTDSPTGVQECIAARLRKLKETL